MKSVRQVDAIKNFITVGHDKLEIALSSLDRGSSLTIITKATLELPSSDLELPEETL